MILTTMLIALAPIQLQVVGEGYLRLEAESGLAYVKSGTFTVVNGKLTHAGGFPLTPPVYVPAEASALNVDSHGLISAELPRGTVTIAQITLAKFPADSKPAELKGVLLFIEKPTLGKPGDAGFGAVRTGKNVAPHNASNLPSIVVNERSEIQSASITIGDIAKVEGPEPMATRISEAVIGLAPPLDVPRVITAATIQSALRSARIALDGIEIQVPEKAVVIRKSRVLKGEEIWSATRKWIADELPTLSSGVLITPIAERSVPLGDIEYTFRSVSETTKSVILAVEAKIGSERLFSQQLVINKTGTANVTNVPITARVGDMVRVVLISGAISVEATGRITWVGTDGHVKVVVEPTRAELIGSLKSDGSVEVNL